MSDRPLPTAAGSILYDESCVGKPGDELFSRDYWASRSALAAGGRGQVLFIRDGDRRWVLRHYRRGGLIARLSADGYLWTGADRTRSFREWRLLSLLYKEGFPVPLPVAARYVRSGLSYRADLITAEIPDARTLADAITGTSLPLAAWRRVGQVIARLHRRGVHHVDLNAHNLLLGPDDAVYVIDFDRARIRAAGAWEHAVLARLKRSLEKIRHQRTDVRFDESAWAGLMDGYTDARSKP
jgi:3-deoxy-D-manno-octulosonic acid kinase